jgi:hypothetical protein
MLDGKGEVMLKTLSGRIVFVVSNIVLGSFRLNSLLWKDVGRYSAFFIGIMFCRMF